MGHLGSGEEKSEIEPFKIAFGFKDEQKKIKKVKKKATGQIDDVEDLLFARNFLKHATNKHGQGSKLVQQ